MNEVLGIAKEIAARSPIAVQLAKEAVNRAYETHLDEGLAFERKNFYLTFASADQKEGMKAFVEKRKPQFTGK
jgi:enoyl-CoA hydratase